MNNGFSVKRLIIFFFGLIVAGILPALLMPPYSPAIGRVPVLSIALVLIYICFALPFVFHYTRRDADKILVGGAVYYKGVVTFSIVVGVASVLLYAGIIRTSVAIGVFLVALFALVIYLYLAYKTTEHISNVKAEENAKTAPVMELRRASANLANQVSAKHSGNQELVSKTSSLSDDLRYLAPSDSAEAAELEEAMLEAFRDVELYLKSGSERDISEAIKTLDEIRQLYLQRKSVY